MFGVVYDPPSLIEGEEITADAVADRRIQLPRGVAPADTVRIVLGVDVGDRVCHWVALAQRETGAAHVIDYGTQDVDVKALSLRKAIRQAIVDVCKSLAAATLATPTAAAFPLRRVMSTQTRTRRHFRRRKSQ